MNYLQLPDDETVIIWQDEKGNAGVIREGAEGWADYQQWLAAGNSPTTTASPPYSLDELITRAKDAIKEHADWVMLPISSQYPRAEIDSWPEQCLEARAWLADHSAETQLIDGITGPVSDAVKAEFCAGILDKMATYKSAAGAVIAWRRAVSEWVEAQTDVEQLQNFVPHFPEVPHAS
jgi:hypothetical protein